MHFNGPQTKFIRDSLYKHPVDTTTKLAAAVEATLRCTMCRNYLFIVKLENSATKIWMGRLPFSHVRMNYFW